MQRILSEIRSNQNAEEHYAICTSGKLDHGYQRNGCLRLAAATIIYATNALQTTNITPPTHFITAEDCIHGKPHPEPYLNGAAALKKDIKRCLVVEDAPSGIKSGLAAGATVLAVCTSHKREEVEKLGAHYVVDNLEKVHLEWVDNQEIKVTIRA